MGLSPALGAQLVFRRRLINLSMTACSLWNCWRGGRSISNTKCRSGIQPYCSLRPNRVVGGKCRLLALSGHGDVAYVRCDNAPGSHLQQKKVFARSEAFKSERESINKKQRLKPTNSVFIFLSFPGPT